MSVIEGGAVTAIPDPGTELRRWRAAGRDRSRPAQGRTRSDGDEHHVAVGNDQPTRLAAGGCDPSPRWGTLNAATRHEATRPVASPRLPASREGRTKDVS